VKFRYARTFTGSKNCEQAPAQEPRQRTRYHDRIRRRCHHGGAPLSDRPVHFALRDLDTVLKEARRARLKIETPWDDDERGVEEV